jgi:hypothetical protein
MDLMSGYVKQLDTISYLYSDISHEQSLILREQKADDACQRVIITAVHCTHPQKLAHTTVLPAEKPCSLNQ